MSITITPLLPFVIDRIFTPRVFTVRVLSALPFHFSRLLSLHFPGILLSLSLSLSSHPPFSSCFYFLSASFLSSSLPSPPPVFRSTSSTFFLQLSFIPFPRVFPSPSIFAPYLFWFRSPPAELLRYARFSWKIARLPAPGHYARRAHATRIM